MVKTESAAISVARTHVEAWSNHDWEAARKSLSGDVEVWVRTTQPIMAPVNTTGPDDYMDGLIKFASGVTPGSARILETTGDRHNALLLVIVEADFGHGTVSLPAARLYQVDDKEKIVSELVVFYAAES